MAVTERSPKHKKHQHPPDNPQWIKIVCHLWHNPLVLLLGDGRITIDQGSGGFQEVARPQRRSVADWPGVPSWKMSIPLMLNQFGDPMRTVPSDQGHTWKKYHKLTQLGRPSHRGGIPPRFLLYGYQIPPGQGGKKWVLESMDDTERIITTGPKAKRHVMERATLTLHVIEWQLEDELKIRRRKKRRHHHHHSHGH